MKLKWGNNCCTGIFPIEIPFYLLKANLAPICGSLFTFVKHWHVLRPNFHLKEMVSTIVCLHDLTIFLRLFLTLWCHFLFQIVFQLLPLSLCANMCICMGFCANVCKIVQKCVHRFVQLCRLFADRYRVLRSHSCWRLLYLPRRYNGPLWLLICPTNKTNKHTNKNICTVFGYISMLS